MYQVVLVDDERLILEGLRRGVKWAEFNCVVAGTADDAVSGAELVRSLHPDILFTDIRMPGLDGLAMLAGLRSEFPKLQVCVLTGYHDIEYAQQAIRLGVSRYLLKPSKMAEIREALAFMTRQLDQTYDPTERKEADSHAGSFIVDQALAFMEKNYARKITLQDVADTCYVSQWHLSKLMNRYLEKSFSDILNSLRIRAAKKLLADPKLRICDISELVGYNDTAHFARTFKRLEGISANEYRNKLL